MKQAVTRFQPVIDLKMKEGKRQSHITSMTNIALSSYEIPQQRYKNGFWGRVNK